MPCAAYISYSFVYDDVDGVSPDLDIEDSTYIIIDHMDPYFDITFHSRHAL